LLPLLNNIVAHEPVGTLGPGTHLKLIQSRYQSQNTMSPFDFISSGRKPKLYISTTHDRDEFKELSNGYWLPSAGRASFHQSIDAMCPEDRNAPNTNSSIYLYWVKLHIKASYYGFFDRLRQAHEKSGLPVPASLDPPARPSFDRPVLILKEHEAEDGATRSGTGFTTCSAYVCLPAPLRAGIGAELLSRPRNRLIVVGFPIDRFDLPQRRNIEPNSQFDARMWTYEVTDVEIKVF
jgi:hypothetical protein